MISARDSDKVEEITSSEVEDESKSASRSTTSDSQVRFSMTSQKWLMSIN